MSHTIAVNESLAIGLRKRLLRETGDDFQAVLDCLFRRVVRRGCQRAGSTHRRVVAFVKHRFAGLIVRELRDGRAARCGRANHCCRSNRPTRKMARWPATSPGATLTPLPNFRPLT